MGKTRRTYRDQVDEWTGDFQRFKAMLRREHQPAAEELVEHARYHADAAGTYNPRDVTEGVLLSVCVGQQREIMELRERVDELEGE